MTTAARKTKRGTNGKGSNRDLAEKGQEGDTEHCEDGPYLVLSSQSNKHFVQEEL